MMPPLTRISGAGGAFMRNTRQQLLKKIYKPFQALPPGSPEYLALAHSGCVWEDYHRPADSEEQGYLVLQKNVASTLREIDNIKKFVKFPTNITANRISAAFAHQSVQIENNQLGPNECMTIDDFLSSGYFKNIDLRKTSIKALFDCPLPKVSHLLPKANVDQVIELRNHLVVSRWISEASLRKQNSPGFSEYEVRLLSALTMKDLAPGGYYPYSFGPKVKLGNYREIPLGVKSNPLRVFPYHVEVPACMERFFAWRERVHEEGKLHPLLIACQTVAYFLHIHPFTDGNGRVSRMIMHDYLLRHGYFPSVFQPFDREDYVKMISDAQDGNPCEFVERVVTTQLETMFTFACSEEK